MKTLVRLSLFAYIVVIWNISGCGKNVEPSLSEQQKASKVLDDGSSWGGSSEKVEVIEVPAGVNPSGLYTLRLTFDTTGESDWFPTTFNATGADDFLATSGATWDWADEIRTDVIALNEATSSELTNMTISETEIQFTFQVISPGGRIDGLDGIYTLKMLTN